MQVRKGLIELVKQAASAYANATGIKPDSKASGFLTNLRDGNLYLYIQKMFGSDTRSQSKGGIERRKWYKEHGYAPLEYLESRIDELDLEDCARVEDLMIGEIVNRFDICAMAADYNDQKGMYQTKDLMGRTIALCVSTENNVKQYHDHWIVPGETYFYRMQDEHHTAVTGLSFKKKVNKTLFKDFEETRLSERPSIPVYLFVHDSKLKKKAFRFEGVFYVNSLPTMDAFEFVRGDLPITEELQKAKDKTMSRIAKMKGSQLVGKRKITMRQFNPSAYVAKLVEDYADSATFVSREDEKRDYVRKQKLASKIGSMGEELVLRYEKNFVSKNVPGKEDDVKLAADSMGYDVRTFRKSGDKIIEIHIEVKTTSEEDPYTKFYMSDHEKWFMENHPDTYWLYRIYDIYSENVRGVYLKGNVAKHIAMNPSSYVCSLK